MKLINEKKLILRVKTNIAAPAPGKINDRFKEGINVVLSTAPEAGSCRLLKKTYYYFQVRYC